MANQLWGAVYLVGAVTSYGLKRPIYEFQQW
jgi:hypothetical protein